MDETAVAAGYIIVYQDVRGKYGSDGDMYDSAAQGSAQPHEVDHATVLTTHDG